MFVKGGAVVVCARPNLVWSEARSAAAWPACVDVKVRDDIIDLAKLPTIPHCSDCTNNQSTGEQTNKQAMAYLVS